MAYRILSIILLLSISYSQAQIDSSLLFEQFILNPENSNPADFLEDPTFKKIDVNNLSINELMESGLNEFDAFRLVQYRERYGAISNSFELGKIYGFDNVGLKKLDQRFVYNAFQKKLRKRDFIPNHKFWYRSIYSPNSRKGYLEKSFQSSLNSSQLLRYRASSKQLNFGILLEQDAGEELKFNQKQFGVDHLQFFIELKNIKHLRKLIIGSFQVNYGLGLNAQAQNGFNNIFNGLSKNNGRGLASSSEGSAHFGIFQSWKIKKNLDTDIYLSSRLLDARIVEHDQQLYYSSISNAGLHRTKTELEKRKSMRQNSYGFALRYAKNRFRTSLLSSYSTYQYPFKNESRLIQNHKNISRQNLNLGLIGSYFFQDYVLHYELATNNFNSLAYQTNLSYRNEYDQNLILHFRHSTKDYFSALSNTNFRNPLAGETGIGFSFQTEIAPGKLNISTEKYYNHSWKYNKDYLDEGFFVNLLFKSREADYISASSRYYRQKRKESNEQNPREIYFQNILKNQITKVLWSNYKSQLKLNLDYNFKLSKISSRRASGTSYFLDFKTQASEKTVIYSRLSFTKIKDFDLRAYAYEYDLDLSFNIKAYSDEAIRYYILMKQNIKNGLKLELKYELNYNFSKDYIGIGVDKRVGHAQHLLKAQLSLKL